MSTQSVQRYVIHPSLRLALTSAYHRQGKYNATTTAAVTT